MNTCRVLPILSALLVLMLITATGAKAQPSSVDLTFSPVPELSDPSGTITDFVLQPDGKIIVFGNFQVLNGVPTSRIARLNADGTGDITFSCSTCDFAISSVVLQNDGKIMISGSANTGNLQPRIFRLHPDGARDTTFTSPFTDMMFPLDQSVDVRAIQQDGKILAILRVRSTPVVTYTLNRLLPGGALDPGFTTIEVGREGITFRDIPGDLVLLPDGKILTAKSLSGGGVGPSTLRRFEPNGAADQSFGTVSVTATGMFGPTNARIHDLEVRPDGSVVMVGFFDKVNAIPRSNIAMIMPAGNVDLTYDPKFPEPPPSIATKAKTLADGKMLLSTSNTNDFIPNTNRIYRLNADGTVDNTYVSPATITRIHNWILDPAEKVLMFADIQGVKMFAHLDDNGAIESSFEARPGSVATTNVIAVQTDGKVIIAGDFERINGVPRRSIGRLNADGSLDSTFDPGSGFNLPVTKIVIQPDGKIVAIGDFSSYQGAARSSIARLNADGSLDDTFDTTIARTTIRSIAIEPSGQILIGGTFTTVNGQARTGIARLNSDGSVDGSLDPIIGTPIIRSLVVQADGKIMVGGTFNGVNGFSRKNLVRLNFDGTLDPSFLSTDQEIDSSGVKQIEALPDGRYLVLSEGVSNQLVKLFATGATDPAFAITSAGLISQFLSLTDGRIVVAGTFTNVNGTARSNIALLSPFGTLDLTFLPAGANSVVTSIAAYANDQIVVGGSFTAIGGINRGGIARINVSPFESKTLFDFDGDGRADNAVFRPSNGYWYELQSLASSFYALQFGQQGDRIAPADYDGDGKTDIAVFRDTVPGAGTLGYFYITNSHDGSIIAEQFGATGDVPVSGDWDGDGKADLAVYRAGSQSAFYYRPSGSPGVNFRGIVWGTTGDKPVTGDFDGDGKLDAAVFRPSNSHWYVLKSSDNQFVQLQFGLSSDIAVAADFDGNGTTDMAVYRPSTGFWYTSTNPATNYGAVQFGVAGDLPVPADYDGDGKADPAVYRPSTGAWYMLRSTAGFTGVQFGVNEDKPIPNAFIP